MFEGIGELFPIKLRYAVRDYLIYAGYEKINAEKFIGFVSVFSVLVPLLISILLKYFFNYYVWITLPIGVVVFVLIVYVWLTVKAENRGKQAEDVLPDALTMIASNIKSGYTVDAAISMAARSEFGFFGDLLKRVGTKIVAGKPVYEALLELSKKVKSTVVERTMWLLAKGYIAGGEMASLLNELAEEIRLQKEMQDEIRANVSMYVMLLFFTAALAAPLLMSLSVIIAKILYTQFSNISVNPSTLSMVSTTSGSLVLSLTKPLINPDFVKLFALILIGLTALTSSMMIGVINRAKEKHGLKYFPIIAIVAYVLFWIASKFLNSLFSGILGT